MYSEFKTVTDLTATKKKKEKKKSTWPPKAFDGQYMCMKTCAILTLFTSWCVCLTCECTYLYNRVPHSSVREQTQKQPQNS